MQIRSPSEPKFVHCGALIKSDPSIRHQRSVSLVTATSRAQSIFHSINQRIIHIKSFLERKEGEAVAASKSILINNKSERTAKSKSQSWADLKPQRKDKESAEVGNFVPSTSPSSPNNSQRSAGSMLSSKTASVSSLSTPKRCQVQFRSVRSRSQIPSNKACRFTTSQSY